MKNIYSNLDLVNRLFKITAGGRVELMPCTKLNELDQCSLFYLFALFGDLTKYN